MYARATLPDRVASMGAFARATHSYWTSVFPEVSRELRRWLSRTQEIPDPVLRAQALQALSKRGNMEGAAAFATFAPRAQRGNVVRAAVAFQSAYNYLDVLSEQPSAQPLENSRRLHEALVAALDFSPNTDSDYYEYHCRDADRGYLCALLDVCRAALIELPSYNHAVASAASRAAERVVAFQAFQASDGGGFEMEPTEQWWSEQASPGEPLEWWETAASGGSSLGVHVMIALAAEQNVEPAEVSALERAYFPWIGALHTMLDHLIDTREDADSGQRNLIARYASPAESAERLGLLAEHSLRCARELEPGSRHELIVVAMACFYLATPQARVPEALAVTRAVLDALGPLVRPALAIFRARGVAEQLRHRKVTTDTGSPPHSACTARSVPIRVVDCRTWGSPPIA